MTNTALWSQYSTCEIINFYIFMIQGMNGHAVHKQKHFISTNKKKQKKRGREGEREREKIVD